MELPLSKRLVKHSSSVHHGSNALVMGKLSGLFADPACYGMALGNFFHVFKTLEECLEASMGTPGIAAMQEAMRPLYRTEAYATDLRYYLGEGWEGKLIVTPALQEYMDHLHSMSTNNPLLLLAHSFTQHLAGLSGGRIIRKLVRKHLGLPAGKGTAAFEYSGSPQADLELKAVFKQRLDKLDLSESESQQLLEEHVRAFEFNNLMLRAFPVGVAAQLRGVLKLTPNWVLAAVWVGALATVAALVLAWRS